MSRVVISDQFAQRIIERRWAEFGERAVQHFRELHEPDVEWFGTAALDAAAHEAVAAARRYGNDSVGGILDYLTLVYMLGRDFATDPQYGDWIGPWLEYHRDSGERLKVEHIIGEALPYADDIEPSRAQWKDALEAALAQLEVLPPLLGGRLNAHQALEACAALIARVWPQRWDLLPAEQREPCLREYVGTITRLGLRTGGEIAAFVMLALRFGGGFCDDIRFARFHTALAEQADGENRIRALLTTAMDLADLPPAQKRST